MTATPMRTGTVLDRILERTAHDLDERRRNVSVDALMTRATSLPTPVSLFEALSPPDIAVVAEFKRASPSRGVFPVTIEPRSVAEAYRSGGASAISVLTDEPFFHGSLADLQVVAEVVHTGARQLPVLRKDFVIDDYQIIEARAHGADAVLLIVAALTDQQLERFLATATDLGLDALVEVHNESEMVRARELGARIIGVNNRDLRDFSVDLATTERLAPLAPPESILVAESGIFGHKDVQRLKRAGADAILVGEGLIIQDDRAAAIRRLLDNPRP